MSSGLYSRLFSRLTLDDALLKLGAAFGRVLGIAGLDGLAASLADVIRRVEIGLPDSVTDDVFALRLKGFGLGIEHQRGAWLHFAEIQRGDLYETGIAGFPFKTKKSKTAGKAVPCL